MSVYTVQHDSGWMYEADIFGRRQPGELALPIATIHAVARDGMEGGLAVSQKQNMNRDPVKRAARRKRQREAAARSRNTGAPEPELSRSQMTHASSSRAAKRRREGQRAMERQRASGAVLPRPHQFTPDPQDSSACLCGADHDLWHREMDSLEDLAIEEQS